MRSRRRSGMTLIEAMVAVTILSMITAIVYGGFSQTMSNKARIEEQADRAQIIRVAMERMVRELSMAFVSIHANPNPALRGSLTAFRGYREGRASRIDFTSFSHRRLYRDSHESDQNELSYFMTRHPEHRDKRVLARREQRRIDLEPERGGEVTILVDDIREFELEYFDQLSLEWGDRWNAALDGTHPNRLPMQVRIRLVVPGVIDPRRDEVYTTRASIPITWALNHAAYNP